MSKFLTLEYLQIQIFLTTLFSILTIFILNKFFIYKNIFLDQPNLSKHKNFFKSKNIPLSGGVAIFIIYSLFFFNIDYFNIFILFLLLLLGLSSDNNNLKSPIIRFILQFLIIIIFISYNKILISGVKIEFLDTLIQNNHLFSLLFSSFCMLILINGSNFIDGVNLQSSGYFLSILLTFLYLHYNFNYFIDLNETLILVSILISFILFNINSKSFLGDSGVYLISFIIGVKCIKLANVNENFSPYFITLLLWYPAFENLFSIIRRLKKKKSISKPDNFHLHQLIILKLSKNLKKSNMRLISSMTGATISVFNLIVFLFASKFVYSSYKLMIIIFSLVILYLSLYFVLKNKIYEKT